MNKNDPKSSTKPAESPKEYQTHQEIPQKHNKDIRLKDGTKSYYSVSRKGMGGRPTKYKPKYCKFIAEYFDRDHTEEYTETHTNRKGETWSASKLRAVPVPTFDGFAAYLGIGITTLKSWKNRFTEFKAAYSHAQALQLEHLATVTGLGLYNSNWAVFMAKNVSDWRDKRDVEHSGDLGFGKLLEGLADKAASARSDRAAVTGMN